MQEELDQDADMDDYNNPETDQTFVIRATNVPDELLKKRDLAKKYFRNFGKVKLLMFKPKKQTLVIEYANEDAMINALELAGEHAGKLFTVTRDTSQVLQKRTRRKSKSEQDEDWLQDPEVRAELQAMAGVYSPGHTYELRSRNEAMDTTPVKKSPATPQRKKKKSTATTSSVAPSGARGKMVEKDLLALIKQQANTVEEKYRVLDARDKLLRLHMKSQPQVQKKATKGTCPDMCPEKERLMRETQHQVALYESEHGKMNPKLAVKQYSRSSADQEVPLPTELRPVKVLQMTMGYLLHKIVSLCDTPEVNLGEWFHFLWDRTRGIRKDITQQELCCQGSVELVEQCARFHIFCSARLVSEDPSIFDHKINTENLTKCLQTLKYMYHDLELKGEMCQNEPEFRAYIILLNLNDGNFMWEVQQLRESIQDSPQVKFALAVYSAIDKNNYVKFFKLVKSTTYLNACILMRYFVQIRLSALKILLKCYAPRILQTTLQINHLTHLLAFENGEATVDFIETYGLYTSENRSRIVLDRHSFQMPDFQIVLDRAHNLVESKRRSSIGEVMCGRQLPERLYESHEPQNSFDANNYLIRVVDEVARGVDLSCRDDQEEDEGEDGEVVSCDTPDKSEDVGKAAVEGFVFTPSTANVEPDLSSGGETFEPVFFAPQPDLNRENELRLIREEEEEKARVEQQERERRKLEELNQRRKLLQEKLEMERRKLEIEKEKRRILLEKQRLEEELRQRKLALKTQREQQEKLKLAEDVKSTLACLLRAVEERVVEEERVKRKTLETIRIKILNRKTRRYLTKWRESARRTRKRKAIDFEPPFFASTTKTIEQQAQEFENNHQVLTLQNFKRYKLGHSIEPEVTHVTSDLRIDLSRLSETLCNRSLEVEARLFNEIYWKVNVSLPDNLETCLDSYFNWSKGNLMIERFDRVTYCFEKQVLSNSCSGLVFVAEQFDCELHERICHSLNSVPLLSKLPVVLILQSEARGNREQLQNLLQEGIISDYLVLIDTFTIANITSLMDEALVFLALKLPNSPPLAMDLLRDFLVKFLIDDLWRRAASFGRWNDNYRTCLKSPQVALSLHNQAIDKIKKIVLNKMLREYRRFPQVFKELIDQIPSALPCDFRYFPDFWDSDNYLGRVENCLNALTLPEFDYTWPPVDEIDLELSIAKYCTIKCGFTNSERVFYKVMAALLGDRERFDGDFSGCMWSDVVEVLAKERLGCINFGCNEEFSQSVFNQLIVVYDLNSLGHFAKSDWFYVTNAVVRDRICDLLTTCNESSVTKVVHRPADIDVNKMYDKMFGTETMSREATRKVVTDLNVCKRLLKDLDDTVQIHNTILKRSRSILNTILEE